MPQDKKMPLISVVIPVYGTEKYLRKCLDSILSQTYKNIEIIIVNDATKDNSEDIISEYLSEYDNIKYVRHTKNKGLFRARISGAEEAEGEYIAFVDSDDYISFDFYRLLVKKALSEKCDIVVGNTVFEDTDGSQSIRQLYRLCFEKDTLAGEEIRDSFFAQTGWCFSWHTVWNKLYSKGLWDKCFEYYKKMEQHLIMTEDIAFSSLLLYNAHKLSTEIHANYFYCKHPEASTDAENIKFGKFEKNMHDLKLSFDFVEAFMRAENSDEANIKYFGEFRRKYSRMYRSLQQKAFPDNNKAKELVDSFLPDYNKKQREDELCFDAVSAKFHNGLDYAKKAILDPNIRAVSFDVFDTLIVRPFYYPADIFDLMNRKFDEITGKSHSISFKKLRLAAEEQAREELSRKSDGEDITLTEIYSAMENSFGISHDAAEQMKAAERQYEQRFCRARKTGKELYDLAVDSGKRVILTSDMYLEYDDVAEILAKNGYTNYERLFLSSNERALKTTGSLFKKVYKAMKLRPENILHIGDNWNSDVTAAQELGFKTFFFPKAREVFENIIGGITTNNSARTEEFAALPIARTDNSARSFGYRTMLAMTANRFFDNPFVSFNENSDFNGDPSFVGYYAIGMHCLGICRWLDELSEMCGYEDIYFLARDGFLPMKAFEIYSRHKGSGLNCHYLHASRTSVLPLMIEDINDLYDLPIEIKNHTPLSVCRMISFCLNAENDADIAEKLSEIAFNADKPFADEKAYRRFIGLVKKNLFDEEKLRKTQNILKGYYSQIKENSAVFDMGYSGRIQTALCKALGRPTDAFFIHTDNDRCHTLSRKGNFRVHSFYSYVPAGSDIIREYLLSDLAPACVGFSEENGRTVPVYSEDKTEYPERFMVRTLHNSALEFVRDLTETFDGFLDDISFIPQEVSYPFEYFLRFAKNEDRKILSLCSLEDKCYGNIVTVRADRFFNNYLCDLTPYKEPADPVPLSRVEMKAVTGEELIPEDNVENALPSVSKKKPKSKVIMFCDRIKESDSIDDKWSKCAENTNNIIISESLINIIMPKLADNWYMTRPGVLDDASEGTVILSNLGNIQPNQDLTFLSAALELVSDKTLLPLGIGFSRSLTDDMKFPLGSDSVKVLSEIAERCKSVGVCGCYSAEVLESFGIKNVSVIGSPVFYEKHLQPSGTDRSGKMPKNISASFKPFYGKFSQKETKLLEYFARNNCKLTASTSLGLTSENIGDDKLFEILRKYQKDSSIYFDTKEWEDSFDDADFAMGMNFFHNALAVRRNVPALFVNYETCGRELCELFRLPYIDISEFDEDKSIEEYYEMADYSEFQKAVRANYSSFCSFLSENGVTINGITGRIIEK